MMMTEVLAVPPARSRSLGNLHLPLRKRQPGRGHPGSGGHQANYQKKLVAVGRALEHGLAL